MSLYSLSELKTALSIPDADLSQDQALSACLRQAEAAAEQYCHRTFALTAHTHYLSGMGTPELPLRQRPVRVSTLSGTLTSGAATVTGLSSTEGLLAGAPAVADSLPAGTTISSVTSSTALTLSANATASGSASILFGLEVYYDAAAYHGDATGAFASTTRLTLGRDFALRRDASGGNSSRSGVLVRLAGSGTAGAIAPWADWPSYGRGSLTARRSPVWVGEGSIKAIYLAGYPAGDVPWDLKSAIHQIAVRLWLTLPRGGMVLGNESKGSGGESYSYGLMALSNDVELSSAKGLLRAYREVVW